MYTLIVKLYWQNIVLANNKQWILHYALFLRDMVKLQQVEDS